MLSPAAEKIIHDYFNLPFGGVSGVRCPYFNNARLNQHGQLRALVGKGTPDEIVDEAKIISLQYKSGLFCKNGECASQNTVTGQPFTTDEVRKFLIDHNLGIECSGFVTQVLRAYYRETKRVDFTKKLYLVSPWNIVRRILIALRPVENINVLAYTNNVNTTVVVGHKEAIAKSTIEPGDVVTMLETGPVGKRNHILLITTVTKNTIEYVHARAWSSEGRYGHGVNRGIITVTDVTKPLTEQRWEENGFTDDKNETLTEAKQANTLEIRRIKI